MGSPVNPQTGHPTSAPAGGYKAYDPTAVAGTVAAGSGTDIWGLNPSEAATPVNVGYLPPPTLATRPGSGAFYRANEVAPPSIGAGPVGGGTYGIQTQTVAELMKALAEMSQTDKRSYIALQQSLYNAGFYGSMDKKSLSVGIFDQATQQAYQSAIQRAIQLNASGQPLTLAEVINQANPAIAARDAEAARQAIKPGFMAQYSDPQTVAALAQSAAQQTLGRNLTTSEVSQFTKAFHQSEQQWNKNQKAAAATQAAGGDVSVQQSPSAEAAAGQFVEQGQRGVEAQGNRMADYVGVLERMLGGL